MKEENAGDDDLRIESFELNQHFIRVVDVIISEMKIFIIILSCFITLTLLTVSWQPSQCKRALI